ncbi:hypothetical protein AB0I66_41305 [Streptomyces sp. NPDC050439]|uniref:hypothetical protein n=1 Tax=unclassified Streptomyces TaxID=2593676 RepID=UPI00344697B0
MDVQRMLKGLLKAGSRGDIEYSVRPYALSTKSFAAFAYVAEQLGYRYAGHAPGTGATNHPYFSFRRRCDARKRAQATVLDHPDLLHGGALPGMKPGGGLRPLPWAQAEVDLLHSRMILDACSRYNARVLGNLIALLILAAVFLGFSGYTSDRVRVVGCLWGALFVLYLIGLPLTRSRRKKHGAKLAAAGVDWPPQHPR